MEAPGQAIEFGNVFVDNATRAEYNNSDNKINTMNVYGTINNVLLYDQTAVTRGNKGYGDVWSCPVNLYWVDGVTHNFAALVDVPDANIQKDEFGMPASFTYTADGVTDVLYDYFTATGQKTGNATVAFTFKHLLAKAHFTLKNSSGLNNYSYTISNVKLTNTLPSGTYTVYTSNDVDAVGSWSSTATATNTPFADIENVANGASTTNADLLLIPGATVSVSFDVTVKINGEEVNKYTYTKPNVATLAQNTVYNFAVELMPGELIQFTATTMPDWNYDVNGDDAVNDDDNIKLQ